MASWVFSSLQSISGKLLNAIQGTASHPQHLASPATDQNESIRKDLEKLSRKLARIQAVQQDAEEREIHDRSVRLWLEELRGVAYEAEDVLDEFYYEVLRTIVQNGDAAIEAYHREREPGTKRKFTEIYTSSSLGSSSAISNTSIPDGMSERIKSITERFEEISKDREALHLREEDGTRLGTVALHIRPPTSSHVDKQGIFGREEEQEEIISLIHPSNGPDFMVLPIVGMGGLGKTLLAQLVYNDFRVGELFEKKAWVSVSEDFNPMRLTKAVIESVRGSCCSFSELSKLQDVLNEEIRGISLFLVLDDVWNEDKNLWECFRVGFRRANIVRIITTTRSTKVATIMQTTSPFPLGSLPMEKCLSLFNHFAFGSEQVSENAKLRAISRGIVKKCRGLPLAIKVLGGILRYEMDEEKWIEVFENDILETDETGEISQALKLSYRKLPVHLRSCFLYLAMFPKGTPLEKDTVVRLWMAQGYVTGNPRTKKTLEEIGSEYFDELQGRSLIDGWYEHNMFHLHDLIYDLARSIFLGTEQLVLEHDQQWNDSYNVGHLCLNLQDGSLGSLAPVNHRVLRTLLFFGDKNADSSIVFSEITCLRALELRDSKLPIKIGILKHLRYLSMAAVEMETFQESICQLYNLQSLDLDCSNVLELPESIKSLINLRYLRLRSNKIKQLPESIGLLHTLHTLSLYCCTRLTQLPRSLNQLTGLCVLTTFKNSIFNLPSGIGKLTNLQSFYGSFDVMGDNMECLGDLKNLNKLSGLLYISGLQNIGDVECCKANLDSKPNLQIIILNFNHGTLNLWKSDSGYRHWKQSFDCSYHGKELHIAISSNNAIQNENVEKIQETVLKSMQPHKNLKVLRMFHYRGIKFPSWLLHSSTSTQPANISVMLLEVLEFSNMPNLVEWEACDGHFPYLKNLVIGDCPNLLKVTIPKEVELLQLNGCGCQLIKFSSKSKLQHISISNCRELICIYYKNEDLPILRSITLSNCPNLLPFSVILEESKNINTRDCGFQGIELALESKIENFSISNNRELNPVDFENLFAPIEEGSVSLSSCPSLRIFSAIPVIAHTLNIHNCGFRDMMFPSRCKKIKISQCPELTSIFWRNGGLNSLNQIVEFDDCPQLGYIRVPSKAKNLHIASCGVQEIILPSQSMIQTLHIKQCLNLFSIHWKEVPFLKEILLEGCHGLSIMSEIPSEINHFELFDCGLHEILFPIQCKIASARILRCLNLTSLHFPEDLHLLETFSIKSCTGFDEALAIPNQVKELYISDCSIPEIRLLPKSRLHKLTITRCAHLTGIKGLQAQNLLINLQISQCPILQFSMDGVLCPMMQMFHMYGCPGMDFNREGKSHFYEGHAMVKCLIASDDEKIILDSSADKRNLPRSSAERSIPPLKNSEIQFLKEDSSKLMEAFELPPLCEKSCQYIKLHLPLLVELEIWNCQTVISVAGLDNLNNLKCLVISGCLELCEWKDTTLPSALWFLNLVSCHKLSCTPLQCQPVENYLETVKVVISKCPLLREICSRITEHNFVRSRNLMCWPRRLLM